MPTPAPRSTAARATGVSGYVGDGSNRWPAVHRSDAARVFRLALARGAPVVHAVAEEGVPVRALAETVGENLGLPVQPRPPQHFGWLGRFLALDAPASSASTRERLGWEPAGPGLLEDLENYTSAAAAGEDQSASPSIGRAK